MKAEFPANTSQRCGRLLCMILEAGGDLEAADGNYKVMLEKNKANALVRKRLVCVAKARGDSSKAVQLLNEYLKDFAGDFSGVSAAPLGASFAAHCPPPSLRSGWSWRSCTRRRGAGSSPPTATRRW